jgi:hypothetical protein
MTVGVFFLACGAPTRDAPVAAARSLTPEARTAAPSLATKESQPAPTDTALATMTPTATRRAVTMTPSPTAFRVTPTATPSATAEPTRAPMSCGLGMGLRQETAPLISGPESSLGLVTCATIGLAELKFPQLDGPIRVLGAPSLAELARKAERAGQLQIPYEALAYGLETGQGTPDQEWQDLVGSTRKARAIADQYGKLLVMGPGYRLMSQNGEVYPAMASLADIWVLQTQQLQKRPPGPEYRSAVEQVLSQIRSGNPDILVWVQITLPPDRVPSAQEWLRYHDLIADLVDGRTYLGVYTWDKVDTEQLLDTMRVVYETACGGGQ